MNDLLVGLTPFASDAAAALVSAVWEGALLAALVWVCLRMLPELSAAARSVVWLSVFALLLGLQIVPLLDRSMDRSGSHVGSGAALHVDVRWSLALAAVWLSLSAFRAVQFVQGVVYLRRLARHVAEMPVDAELEALLADAAGRRVRLCVSDAVARPSVIGFFQPRILIPAKLMESLAPEELRQVLVHEAEHLRRADDWTNLLQKLALVVFPLNPALAWVERRLCAERELACDDRVLAVGNGRKAYALCLTHLAEFALLERGFSLILGAWERRPELVQRVHRILRKPAKLLPRRVVLGLTGGVLAASVAGALVLARSPQVVSFAPVDVAKASALQQPDLRELGRELGGTPQLVKATLPVKVGAAQKAVVARKKKAVPVQVRLAGLRMALQSSDSGRLLVMTEWTEVGAEQRMMLADMREKQAATAVPAIYIVATPNGLLIVQI